MRPILLISLITLIIYTLLFSAGYWLGLRHGFRDAADAIREQGPLPNTLEYRPEKQDEPDATVFFL